MEFVILNEFEVLGGRLAVRF